MSGDSCQPASVSRKASSSRMIDLTYLQAATGLVVIINCSLSRAHFTSMGQRTILPSGSSQRRISFLEVPSILAEYAAGEAAAAFPHSSSVVKVLVATT